MRCRSAHQHVMRSNNMPAVGQTKTFKQFRIFLDCLFHPPTSHNQEISSTIPYLRSITWPKQPISGGTVLLFPGTVRKLWTFFIQLIFNNNRERLLLIWRLLSDFLLFLAIEYWDAMSGCHCISNLRSIYLNFTLGSTENVVSMCFRSLCNVPNNKCAHAFCWQDYETTHGPPDGAIWDCFDPIKLNYLLIGLPFITFCHL